MSFFHSIPSDITLNHSLHTSSAEHNDLASKNERIISAIDSKPLAKLIIFFIISNVSVRLPILMHQ
jgi:hypothetical protein